MKNKETFISLLFGILGLIAWYFPEINLKLKIVITLIIVLSIIFIYIRQRLSYVFRKYWQEIISVSLLLIVYLIFKNAYYELLIPAATIIFTSIAISFLISTKYGQTFVYKKRILLKIISFNEGWHLNHWGGNYASVYNNKMIFQGTAASGGADGSNIDLIDFLEIGTTYEIQCFAKSASNTTGMFQLWCHDKSVEPNGVNEATVFRTPSTNGDIIGLPFTAQFNHNIRIHLQYRPGEGRIEISNVKIFQLR